MTSGVAAVLGLVLADAAFGREISFYGTLAIGPYLASAGSTVPRTAAVSGLAVAAAALLAWYNDDSSAEATVRIIALALASALSLFVARQRIQRERRLADVTAVAVVAQHALLRPAPAQVKNWGFAARYEATTEFGVGGDLYDVSLHPDGSILVLVADVQGKGLHAVRTAAEVLAAFRRAVFSAPTLADLGEHLDEAVSVATDDEGFVTAVVCRFSAGGRVEVANFGHPPPMLVKATGVVPLEPSSYQTPLGLKPSVTVEAITLLPGERLLIFTDGLTEARNTAREFLGVDPLFSCKVSQDASDCLDELVETAKRHTGSSLRDDLTLLAATLLNE
ncbi:MAG TPA: PP2C family protein-serine/threonine phosphatase [Acidimicrobiales bacterium]|jgi:serine phosphatase RsbU (regulator of sigma subunit)|nr:PP2C family protein-serine/threonine phosphatase [Acidimicrobiales bacterium]